MGVCMGMSVCGGGGGEVDLEAVERAVLEERRRGGR